MGLLLSVRTPLAHSASLAFENWTGRNNNEAEKKGKEAERVKLACVATIPTVAVAVVGHKSQTGQINSFNDRISTQLM